MQFWLTRSKPPPRLNAQQSISPNDDQLFCWTTIRENSQSGREECWKVPFLQRMRPQILKWILDEQTILTFLLSLRLI